MNKKTISLINGLYILANNKNPVLITMDNGHKKNVMSATWLTPVSIDPPKVAVCVMKKNYSNSLLMESDSYVINGMEIPNSTWVKTCGTLSGSDIDKFQNTGLTAVPSVKVTAPLILECDWHLECNIIQKLEMGTHTMFVGQLVSSSLNSELIERYVCTINWQ